MTCDTYKLDHLTFVHVENNLASPDLLFYEYF